MAVLYVIFLAFRIKVFLNTFKLKQTKMEKRTSNLSRNTPNARRLSLKRIQARKLLNGSKTFIASTLKKCRICKSESHLQLLFAEENAVILNIYRTCTKLKALPDDPYPKYICNNCIKELFMFQRLWSRCRITLQKLDQLIDLPVQLTQNKE